jgi:hypothetical protein
MMLARIVPMWLVCALTVVALGPLPKVIRSLAASILAKGLVT